MIAFVVASATAIAGFFGGICFMVHHDRMMEKILRRTAIPAFGDMDHVKGAVVDDLKNI